ncbi:chromosome segregation protein SMC [Permianibacter aggregans]|uniref:Chromosome partition protein Smc n=1 Tax=Permianibacter aggregans TaxID=1510150 RepID=A0A4R6UZZ6_9GAMM|nr:chromosome segregation protein SMC [Permianibacter aggregans]QGX41444.1 chromosome segregation protein SMC [Permianibacter aggregans]TDQ51235.1 condensin subunit Smc [Permianibacter aggregans]
MRLKQIKLAGFKSFVDPTTVPFPTNLTAIVGPNGCGKSNVIDAVRWVMGESSAKNLRAEESTDVIFNGSTARKPVGQASIELVFDNSDGSLGGEWASYNEISVKRLITRDAQNSYFLNGARCRRKDITDIFLGTGLGPRSYAIIQQGTISRLIESKPHELRIFIEEAAGISKYKERRKETESRINQTRENMSRLSDIRQELDKQIAHLQRQAQAAAKFKELREEERGLKAKVSAIRYKELDEKVQAHEQAIGVLSVDVEARMAEIAALDAGTEDARSKHIDLTDTFNAVQGKYHGITAEIVRLEQSIKYTRERRHTLRDDLVRLEQSQRGAEEHLALDTEKVAQVQSEIEDNTPELLRLEEIANGGQQNLSEHEEAIAQWQQEWDEFNRTASDTAQKAQVERTRVSHYETVLARIGQRHQRIQQEIDGLNAQPGNDELLALEEKLAETEMRADEVRDRHAQGVERINRLRQERQELTAQIDAARNELNQLRGKKVALESLQQAAQGANDEPFVQWLQRHNLNNVPRLSDQLRIEAGWETALEAVLGDQLQALVVNQLDDVLAALAEQPGAAVHIIDNQSVSGNSARRSLAQLIQAGQAPALLHSVYPVESINEAFSQRQSLAAHERFVTRDGFVVGRNFLKINASNDGKMGVLERAKLIESLTAEIDTLQEKLAELEERSEQARDDLRTLEAEWGELQKQLTAAERDVVEVRSQLQQRQSKLEQLRRQREQLINEQKELSAQREEDEERLAQSRANLQAAIEQMGDDTDKREELQARREELRQLVDSARMSARDAKDIYHKLALRMEALRAELTSTQNSERRVREQLAAINERREQLEMQLEESMEPLTDMETDLENALNKRITVEQELTQAREALSEVDQEVRVHERRRHEIEQQAQAVRMRLEQLRVERGELTVRRDTQLEFLKQEERTLEEALAQLEEHDREHDITGRLTEIAEKIQRLGAINLAAIEEFQTQSERKTYMDAQFDDLTKALETLEDAIRKIDHETRSKFKDTFDFVNKTFQELFPKVFGGGHAYLEMTGEDLLDTGITLMARPPGKRNSTIHLLSGGEKALTAIALVFSIFQLNPAPFCMLDEVDAPLDDANVGRFCNLVKEMSKSVQFIYISHNKIAMEMGEQLCGVTMQEPGVSRIVAVDIDEAAAMAAA